MIEKIDKNLLLVNDLHAGRDNLQEFTRNWEEAVQVAKENDAEILIGGDVFLSRSSQTLDVLTAVHKAGLCALYNDVTVRSFPGNHDLVDQMAAESYLDFFPYLQPRTSGVLDMSAGGRSVHLYYIRYYPESSFEGLLNQLLRFYPIKDDNTYRILYCHQGIRGGLSTASEDEVPTHVFKGFDKVLVGHYHDAKHIPDTNIDYIGASRQHNFGEDEKKGYTLVRKDGSTEFIQNQANIRYSTIYAEFKNYTYTPNDIQALRGKYGDRVRIRVVIDCTSEQSKAVNRDLLFSAGANKVVFNVQATDIEQQGAESLMSEKFDRDSLIDEYGGFCERKGENPEPGIQYLTQIQKNHVENQEN